jgi:hypothetical protein
MEQSGVALATARWGLESMPGDVLARSGTAVELTMLHGAAVFTLQGPWAELPSAVAGLLGSLLKPSRTHLRRSRDRAALEVRRFDHRQALWDMVAALCWQNTSFELPAWGLAESLSTVGDASQRRFHDVWYRPANMTLIALGPGGGSPFVPALEGASATRGQRESPAPGQAGVPVHQVQNDPFALSLAGAALPGPSEPAAALIVRTRLQELLEGVVSAGKLTGPSRVDMLVTHKSALVFAAEHHPRGMGLLTKTEQAEHLQTLEGLVTEALQTPAGLLQETRARTAARLVTVFLQPALALEILAPLAAVLDAPPDLHTEVLAAPQAQLTQAFAQAAKEDRRFSLRRRPEAE